MRRFIKETNNGPGDVTDERIAQYTSVYFTQTLMLTGMVPSIGTVGDAYDNALWGARNQPRRVQLESLVLRPPATDCRAGSLTPSVPPACDAGAGAISRSVGNAASETGIGSSKASIR